MVEMTQTEALEYKTPAANGGLKTVILAAGKETITADGQPLILQTLGDCSILECVAENALQAVRVEDIYIVVGERQEQVRSMLGERYNYVVQQEPLGTGDAVLHVSRLLGDFPGNLLILYGDTPLLRPGTIRGLLNRHRLRKAHLTVLTANVDRPLPYGRIIRDASGEIIDIIEDKDASAQVREIHELNAGAYVVNAGILAAALGKLFAAPRNGESQLTDCVHQLIRRGCRSRVVAHAADHGGEVMVPKFEVDPFWPKPLPNHWILGMSVGVAVDAHDNVWIVHRPQTLDEKESYLTRSEADCCTAAPDVLEFDPAGNLIRHWGMAEGHDWPRQRVAGRKRRLPSMSSGGKRGPIRRAARSRYGRQRPPGVPRQFHPEVQPGWEVPGRNRPRQRQPGKSRY